MVMKVKVVDTDNEMVFGPLRNVISFVLKNHQERKRETGIRRRIGMSEHWGTSRENEKARLCGQRFQADKGKTDQ
jgi:hypothetical protein